MKRWLVAVACIAFPAVAQASQLRIAGEAARQYTCGERVEPAAVSRSYTLAADSDPSYTLGILDAGGTVAVEVQQEEPGQVVEVELLPLVRNSTTDKPVATLPIPPAQQTASIRFENVERVRTSYSRRAMNHWSVTALSSKWLRVKS